MVDNLGVGIQSSAQPESGESHYELATVPQSHAACNRCSATRDHLLRGAHLQHELSQLRRPPKSRGDGRDLLCFSRIACGWGMHGAGGDRSLFSIDPQIGYVPLRLKEFVRS